MEGAGHDLAADAELQAALQALAPSDVRIGRRWITAGDLAALTDVEAAHVSRAVPRRQYEFATGRVLLRQLIGQDVAIPVAADRSPVLPAGVRGSLAHDRELAVAAVSDQAGVRAIGVDVEPATALEPAVAALVLRSDEPGLDAHLAFTMKEATYKAWSALGGRLLDHHDVRLAISGRSFRAEVLPDGTSFDGRTVAAAGRWVSLVVVRPTST